MINSKTNENIKYIKSLNDKKYRVKYNRFFIEGTKLLKEMSSDNFIAELIVYSTEILENTNDGRLFLKELELNKIKTKKNLEVSKAIYEYISDTVTPQGVMGIFEIKKNETTLESKIKNNETFLILDKIQDSGNLGTIIRIANSFNIKNIICTKDTADMYSPKVIRSTMGAINKVALHYLEKEEIIYFINEFKKYKYDIIATDLKSNNNLQNTKVNKKTVYVMGNESQGVSKEFFLNCSNTIKIPQEKTQESLNVGVATGIVLYNWYINNNDKS